MRLSAGLPQRRTFFPWPGAKKRQIERKVLGINTLQLIWGGGEGAGAWGDHREASPSDAGVEGCRVKWSADL